MLTPSPNLVDLAGASSRNWMQELRSLATEFGSALSLEAEASLARYSTLRIGGPAEALVEVGSVDALKAALAVCSKADISVTMVGRGANVLFPDAGLRGVVCRLRGEFSEFSVPSDGGTKVSAGAGALLSRVAKTCATSGLLGLEALAGFPASVGGAITMNAGCYGTEIKDWLDSIEVLMPSEKAAEKDAEKAIERHGVPAAESRPLPDSWELRVLSVDDLEPRYRWTRLREMAAVVVRAKFSLQTGDADEALKRLDRLNRQRWKSLPSGKPNAGSIFRNPEGDYAGRLLEASGFKGLTIGGAAFSEKHANVIVNLGDAKSAEVVELMATAQSKVAEKFGVDLQAELVRF